MCLCNSLKQNVLIVSPTSFNVASATLLFRLTTTGGHTFESRAPFAITLFKIWEWAYLQELLYHQKITVQYLLSTIPLRKECTNLFAQVVLFFSVFVLTTRICPVLAQPVPDSSRRPLVCCEARCVILLAYIVQY